MRFGAERNALRINPAWHDQRVAALPRYILGVLGFEFRNPYKLRRQKASLNTTT